MEYLPHKDQWLLTFSHSFGDWSNYCCCISLCILPNNSCESADYCPSHINRGWRYVFYTNGSIVLAMAILRLTVVRLKKLLNSWWLIIVMLEAVEVLQEIAHKYNRKCSLTLEQLLECGEIESNDDYRKHFSFGGTLSLMFQHLKILFATKNQLGQLPCCFLMGLFRYCLSIIFSVLPEYLATRGANISADTTSGVYRDLVISNVSSVGGPIIAGYYYIYYQF